MILLNSLRCDDITDHWNTTPQFILNINLSAGAEALIKYDLHRVRFKSLPSLHLYPSRRCHLLLSLPSPKPLAPTQIYALYEIRAHFLDLLNARVRPRKAPYDVKI